MVNMWSNGHEMVAIVNKYFDTVAKRLHRELNLRDLEGVSRADEAAIDNREANERRLLDNDRYYSDEKKNAIFKNQKG